MFCIYHIMVNNIPILVIMVRAMFLLKGILRAESQEKILIYITLNGSGYGKAVADFFGLSQNSVQKQLIRLEEDGVIVGRSIGQLREYTFNPRYLFLEELKALLQKAYQSYPQEIVTELLMQRKRPRKSGKTIKAYDRKNDRSNKV